jgi:hypothetical protein
MHFLAILGFELRALRMGGWPGEEPAWESDHTGLSGSVWGMSGMWTDGISTGLCWLLTWLLWAISSPVKLQQHSMEPLLEARRGSQEVSRVPSLGTFMWWCILGASPKLSLVMGSGPFPWGHCSPKQSVYFIIVCVVLEIEPRVLCMLDKCPTTSAMPSALSFFISETVSHHLCLCCSWTWDPPTFTSQVAGITGVNHHT